MSEQIRLTQTVQKGGCAAKVAANELRKILGTVQFPTQDSSVLVDGKYFDDAAVYKIHDQLALVQTLDFFTPIVDSPYWFGRIAAANSLSDVYAMGATPKTALAILAFPLSSMDSFVITQVLQGACDLMQETGVNFLGGHSIDDDTLKFGLSVSGFVNPKNIWSNRGARTEDVLILTKPLGTGAMTAGLKRSAWNEEQMLDVLQSMGQVNQVLDLLQDSELLTAVHAATDITGFGLLGHAKHIALGSEKKLHFQVSQVPRFQKFQEAIEKSFLTKAHRTNREYIEGFVEWDSAILDWQKLLLLDPQTSGGLLLSVDPQMANVVLQKLRSRFLTATIVGHVGQSITSSSQASSSMENTDAAVKNRNEACIQVQV